MNTISVHPYKPFIPETATRLIIGSIPPLRFCSPAGTRALFPNDVDFYYGSRSNSFWEILSAITGTQLEYRNGAVAVAQRKELLNSLHTGITDIIKTCVHDNGNADDASLREITYKDIRALLHEHPYIDTLIYTSEFIVKLMNAAGVPDQKRHTHWDKTRKNGMVSINGKNYTVHVLYSPSPNALRSIRHETRLAQYQEVFLRTYDS